MTKRQAQLLAFLRERALAGDVAPSFEEMGVAIGVTSKGFIANLLKGLERRGAVKLLPGAYRAVTVTGIDDYARGYRDGFAAAQAQGKAA